MLEFNIAKKSYFSMRERSFKELLDLFLVGCYIKDKTLITATLKNFQTFNFNSPSVKETLKAVRQSDEASLYTNERIKGLDKVTDTWYKKNDLTNFRAFFNQYRIIEQEDFVRFFGHDKKDRQCYWCKIYENDINKLHMSGKIATRDLKSDLLHMDVNRIKPYRGYEMGNIAITCHWCRNAKSDEFDDTEFKPIAQKIKEVWDKRLAGIK
jgi:hypothetical protein